jgi:hypothetical protein
MLVRDVWSAGLAITAGTVVLFAAQKKSPLARFGGAAVAAVVGWALLPSIEVLRGGDIPALHKEVFSDSTTEPPLLEPTQTTTSGRRSRVSY